jgi:DNA-binding response OmpR family regulator
VKILLVEDEAELATTLRGVLERESHVVDLADRIDMALEAARGGARGGISAPAAPPRGVIGSTY